MTSNIGARQVKDFGNGLGFETSSQRLNQVKLKRVIQRVKKTFPQFLKE